MKERRNHRGNSATLVMLFILGMSASRLWMPGILSAQVAISGTSMENPRYAVIVMGSDEFNGFLNDQIRSTAGSVHHVLTTQMGYQEDDVYYLNDRGPGHPEEIYADAINSEENVRWALTEWLDGALDLDPGASESVVIYFVGHGLTGWFHLRHNDEYISEDEMRDWIDDALLDNGELTFKGANIIVESCYSGAFLDDIGGENRVAITSTDDSHTAAVDTWTFGQAVFTHYYLAQISDGLSCEDAYEVARDQTNGYTYYDPQEPWVDDQYRPVPPGQQFSRYDLLWNGEIRFKGLQ